MCSVWVATAIFAVDRRKIERRADVPGRQGVPRDFFKNKKDVSLFLRVIEGLHLRGGEGTIINANVI